MKKVIGVVPKGIPVEPGKSAGTGRKAAADQGQNYGVPRQGGQEPHPEKTAIKFTKATA